MLSQAQVEQYHRDGYVVPDYRVSSAVLDSIKARHAALVERKPEFRDYCPALLDQDPGFFDYCNDPAILDMVEQLIGHDIALWNSSFLPSRRTTGGAPVAPGRRILANHAAGHLHRLACGRCLHAPERLSSGDRGLPP
ncbi:MAG: hypothetical protein R3E48_21320 [Burkholderiaceae bacterium]